MLYITQRYEKSSNFMKINWKKINPSIVINMIMGLILLFFLNSWFFGTKNINRENEILKSQIEQLELKKDSLASVNLVLVENYGKLEKSAEEIRERIKVLEVGLSTSDKKLQAAKTTVAKDLAELGQLNAELDNLRKGVFIISNDSLLISLKQKLNRK